MAYGLITNARFDPFTFEELLRGPVMATEYLLKQEALILDLMDKAATLEILKNDPLDANVYNNYLNFQNQLENAAADLSKNGVAQFDRNTIKNLRNAYNATVLPIQDAYNRRAADRKAYNDLLTKDPSRISSFNPNTASLDSYMSGTPEMFSVSGDAIMELAAAEMLSLSRSRALNSGITTAMDGALYKIGSGYGYSEKDIESLKKYPEIQNIINQIKARPEIQRLGEGNLSAVENRIIEGILKGRAYDWKNSYMNAPRPSNQGSSSNSTKGGGSGDKDDLYSAKTKIIRFSKDNPNEGIEKLFNADGTLKNIKDKKVNKYVGDYIKHLYLLNVSDVAIKAAINGLDDLSNREIEKLVEEFYPNDYKNIFKESEMGRGISGYAGLKDYEKLKSKLGEVSLIDGSNISLDGGLSQKDIIDAMNYERSRSTNAAEREFLWSEPYSGEAIRTYLKSALSPRFRSVTGINPDNTLEYIYDDDDLNLFKDDYSISSGNFMFDENNAKFLVRYNTLDKNGKLVPKIVEFEPNLNELELYFIRLNYNDNGKNRFKLLEQEKQKYLDIIKDKSKTDEERQNALVKYLEINEKYNTIRNDTYNLLNTKINNSLANINMAASAASVIRQ